jgi:hypothetical protein
MNINLLEDLVLIVNMDTGGQVESLDLHSSPVASFNCSGANSSHVTSANSSHETSSGATSHVTSSGVTFFCFRSHKPCANIVYLLLLRLNIV